MEEIADLKAAVDVLIARSMAQEALLCFIIKTAQPKPNTWGELDAQEVIAALQDRLRYSSMTNTQIALYKRETQRLLQRLHELGGPDLRDPSS